jgi:hypothetical protein
MALLRVLSMIRVEIDEAGFTRSPYQMLCRQVGAESVKAEMIRTLFLLQQASLSSPELSNQAEFLLEGFAKAASQRILEQENEETVFGSAAVLPFCLCFRAAGLRWPL